MNKQASGRFGSGIHLVIAVIVLLAVPVLVTYFAINGRDQLPSSPVSQELTEVRNAADLQRAQEILQSMQLDAPSTDGLDEAVEELL